VIEDALRRDLGLDLFDRLLAQGEMDEDEAISLAVEAQHATRGVDGNAGETRRYADE
jgi:hypothetical protein